MCKTCQKYQKAHNSNLSIKDVNYNKKIGKIVKSLFSEKVNTNENITIFDNNNIMSSEIEILEKLEVEDQSWRFVMRWHRYWR